MARNQVGGPEPDRQRRAVRSMTVPASAHYPADICGTAEPAAGWRSGRVRWLRRTIRRRTRRASGCFKVSSAKPYRQETGVGTRAVSPERQIRAGQDNGGHDGISFPPLTTNGMLGVNRISKAEAESSFPHPITMEKVGEVPSPCGPVIGIGTACNTIGNQEGTSPSRRGRQPTRRTLGATS